MILHKRLSIFRNPGGRVLCLPVRAIGIYFQVYFSKVPESQMSYLAADMTSRLEVPDRQQ